MWKIVLPVICVVTGVAGLFLGIVLGALLGRIGSLEIISFILRIPATLIKSPKELRAKWKMWQELAGSRKVERLRRAKRVKVLEEKITGHRKEIRKIGSRILRLKWEFREPE